MHDGKRINKVNIATSEIRTLISKSAEMLVKKVNARRKKIVWVSPLIIDVHLHKTSRIEILRALSRRGHEVRLIAYYSSRKDFGQTLDVPTILFPIRYLPFISPSAYTIMLSLILPVIFIKTKPDYVVIEPDVTALGMVTTLFLAKKIRLKIILDIRSTPVSLSGLGGFFKNFFFGIAVHLSKRFFNGMTIITEMMKKEVCQAFCIDPYKVGVWSSGVSTVLFNPMNYDAASVKKEFGLEGKFVVFYHGVINLKRGIPQAIKAIQILDKYSDIVLFLLGKEEDFDVKRLAQDLNVEKRVIMHKSVSYTEVPKYISLCDVGLVVLPNLPDWRNQCPLNLLEYLSMSKPVIATDIPANRKILENHKCGIYVKSANPEEVARAILYAYENRAKIKVWGALGRRIVEEKYTWDKVAEKFETYLIQR